MATLSIPIADYLEMSFRPDREYVDGEIVERNMGKWEHARMQAMLAAWFGEHERAWGVQTATEWRVQVSRDRVRIPDLVLVGEGAQPDVLTVPPVLVVEILSPDDSYSEMQRRASDYAAMGVKTVWILDPQTRSARVCENGDWKERRLLSVTGTAIHADADLLFARLDG